MSECERTPGRCGHVDGCLGVVAAVVEASKELCPYLQSPGSPQTLHCSHLGEGQETRREVTNQCSHNMRFTSATVDR